MVGLAKLSPSSVHESLLVVLTVCELTNQAPVDTMEPIIRSPPINEENREVQYHGSHVQDE